MIQLKHTTPLFVVYVRFFSEQYSYTLYSVE